ncbi:MAG: hypothetical protein R6V10_02965 [bacterium]
MKQNKPVFHILFSKEENGYTGICLELNVASEGDTLEEARKNIREAVGLYLESVYQKGDEEESIPRPAPMEYWLKYLSLQERKLREALRENPEPELEFEEAVA